MFRIATPGDAEQAIEIIRRSIEELCVADHRGDQDILRMWLANKTADDFRSWGNVCRSNSIGCRTSREAMLYRWRNKRCGNHFELRLTLRSIPRDKQGYASCLGEGPPQLGHKRVRLVSTQPAHKFYHAAGYHDVGPPEFWGRLPGYPMEKQIA